MKILVICQYYYPEPFRIHDICEEMVRRGHEVSVVTGEPNYPEGEIYKDYKDHKRKDEVINGVKVHRCRIIPRKKSSFFRVLNYFSFAVVSSRYVRSKKCAPKDGGKFDVVFVNQLSPVMMAEAALKYKKKHNVPAVLYCLDIWPESIVAGGVKRNSLIYKFFYYISKRIYRRMDSILVSSRMFKDYICGTFGINEDMVDYLPQYAESLFDNIPPHIENDITDLVFAGNIGKAQSVDTILLAAEKLKNEPICFHIVGGGSELEDLKKMAEEKELSNVIFYGRRNIEEMPHFYAMADAMLVTLKKNPVLSMTLPGKVQSYMAAGKPIIGAIDGETADIIKRAECGFCADAEDADGLAGCILRFVSNINRIDFGENARGFYEMYLERLKFMDSFEKDLDLLKVG